MNRFKVGQRVKVGPLDGTWAQWALGNMPGRTGVVVAVKDEGTRYLVRFDKAIPPDRPGRLATKNFHFGEKYLQEV